MGHRLSRSHQLVSLWSGGPTIAIVVVDDGSIVFNSSREATKASLIDSLLNTSRISVRCVFHIESKAPSTALRHWRLLHQLASNYSLLVGIRRLTSNWWGTRHLTLFVIVHNLL
jgi:hypothetical protein